MCVGGPADGQVRSCDSDYMRVWSPSPSLYPGYKVGTPVVMGDETCTYVWFEIVAEDHHGARRYGFWIPEVMQDAAYRYVMERLYMEYKR